MTDNEIKQALEWHLNDETNCDECPYKNIHQTNGLCVIEMQKNALDLINRQQAEIERLTLEVEAVNELINPLPFKSNFDRAIETAKSEAIKEFIKKFEKKIKDVKFTMGQTWEIKCALKQTLKEMTEVSE